MDQCCPSPDYPVIQPDPRAQKLRRILKQLYYGQAMICFVKLILYGGLAAIFQLINLWVIYTAFATMHFCSVLIYLIMSSFDLLFAVMDWQRYEAAMKDKESSKMVEFLFIVQIVYFIIAITYSFKAYGHFKQLFFIQIGSQGGYRRGPGESSDEEDPRDNQYQRQQRAMREQYNRQLQARQQQQLLGLAQNHQVNQGNMGGNSNQIPGGVNHNQNVGGYNQNQSAGVQGYPPVNNRQGNYQPPNASNAYVAPIVQHDFTRKSTQNSSAASNAINTINTLRSQNTMNSSNNNDSANRGQGFNAFSGQGHRLQ